MVICSLLPELVVGLGFVPCMIVVQHTTLVLHFVVQILFVSSNRNWDRTVDHSSNTVHSHNECILVPIPLALDLRPALSLHPLEATLPSLSDQSPLLIPLLRSSLAHLLEHALIDLNLLKNVHHAGHVQYQRYLDLNGAPVDSPLQSAQETCN